MVKLGVRLTRGFGFLAVLLALPGRPGPGSLPSLGVAADNALRRCRPIRPVRSVPGVVDTDECRRSNVAPSDHPIGRMRARGPTWSHGLRGDRPCREVTLGPLPARRIENWRSLGFAPQARRGFEAPDPEPDL